MGTGRCGAERCRRSRCQEQKGSRGTGAARGRARTSHHQNTGSSGEAELQIAMAVSLLSLDSVWGCVLEMTEGLGGGERHKRAGLRWEK